MGRYSKTQPVHLQKPRLNDSYCTPSRCEVGFWGQHVGKGKEREKEKKNSVNQEHLGKDPATSWDKRSSHRHLKYETVFRNNSQGRKKKSSINLAERNRKGYLRTNAWRHALNGIGFSYQHFNKYEKIVCQHGFGLKMKNRIYTALPVFVNHPLFEAPLLFYIQ